MYKKKRYLITTSDEATWKFDQPIIFLNNWCKLHDRKHIWEKLDYKISDTYLFEKSNNKKEYHKEIKNIKDKLLIDLITILNKHHQVNYNKRFWLIFIGPYLNFIINKLSSRINELKKSLQNNEISGTTVYEYDYSSLICQNDLSQIVSLRENKFDNILNHKILKLLTEFTFQEEFIKDKNNIDLVHITYKKLNPKYFSYKKIEEIFLKFYSKIARKFVKENDAFIVNTYLSLSNEIKLELALGQIPQIWKLDNYNLNFTQVSKEKKPDTLKRQIFQKEILKKSNNELDKIIRSLFFELLPTCYLEGFSFLDKFVNELPWPMQPKFIFTSNNYTLDLIFKLWTAKKVTNGTKYFIGQHGNNFGTRWDKENSTEETTPNKFITWGWSNDKKKHFPSFIFKNVGKKIDYDKKGNLLLVEQTFSKSIEFDNSNQLLKYFDNQKIFANNLKTAARKNLIVRLHSDTWSKIIWDEKSRWLEFDPELKIDKSSLNFYTSISKCRLVVHGYDSTTMLETLSLNMPTLAFWENSENNVKESNGLNHLNDKAKAYYQMLVDAGIIHFTPVSVANKVNEIWDDVEGWWSQEYVQTARNQFCEIYAKNVKNPLSELKKILLS